MAMLQHILVNLYLKTIFSFRLIITEADVVQFANNCLCKGIENASADTDWFSFV